MPQTQKPEWGEWGHGIPSAREARSYGRRYAKWGREQKQAVEKAEREEQLRIDLEKLRAEQEEALGRLTSGFRTAAETAAAQQLGGVLRGVGQTAARRGIIGSGIAAGAETQARTQLAGQALQEQLEFRTRLQGLFQQQAHEFKMGRYDFFEAMDLLNAQGELQIKLAQFRQDMMRDQRKQQALFGLGSAAGNFLATFFPFPSVPGPSGIGGGATGGI